MKNDIVKSMPKFKVIYLFLLLIIIPLFQPSQAYQCAPYCQSCFDQTPFGCTSCNTQNNATYVEQYVWSCQHFIKNDALYVVFSVVIVCLNLFMLMMGFGVYQSVYEQIQLASILLWVQVGQNRVIGLQGTNFAISYSNSFIRTFGAQFILILFVISVFYLLVATVEKIPHNSSAILIRRKRVIFPTRLIGLIYNMVFFSSLVSIIGVATSHSIDVFQLILSILGILFATALYVGLFVLCNFKKFKLDNPHYYVITQKMLSTRWWIKNKLFFSMTNNFIIISVFVLGFSTPRQSIIPIIVSQCLFILYLIIFVQWIKIRYKLINVIGCCCFLGILICLDGMNSSTLSQKYTDLQNYQKAYTFFIIIMCCILIFGYIIEILAQKNKIGRQLVSLKNRYILCEKIDKEVQMTKYDEHSHRQKVTEFQNNLVYGQDLSKVRQKFNIKQKETISTQ